MPGTSSRLAHGRRRFLKLVGMAGISSAVGSTMASWAAGRKQAPGSAIGAGPAPASRPGSAAGSAPTDSARATEKPPEISDDARALAAIVQRRYGRHLDAKQLEAVTLEIQNRLDGGKRLRDVKLANHEEPDFTFHA